MSGPPGGRPLPRTSWQVLSEQLLLESPYLKVREQRVLLPNGHQIDQYHLIESPPWAAVLALTAERRVVLVRQYRHGVGRMSLELPAGIVDPDEPTLAAAQRELREETGFVAETWHALAVLSPEPARQPARAHLFVALGARSEGRQELEPSEALEVVTVAERELLGRIDSGEIAHGVHVAAVLLAAQRGWLSLS